MVQKTLKKETAFGSTSTMGFNRSITPNTNLNTVNPGSSSSNRSRTEIYCTLTARLKLGSRLMKVDDPCSSDPNLVYVSRNGKVPEMRLHLQRSSSEGALNDLLGQCSTRSTEPSLNYAKKVADGILRMKREHKHSKTKEATNIGGKDSEDERTALVIYPSPLSPMDKSRAMSGQRPSPSCKPKSPRSPRSIWQETKGSDNEYIADSPASAPVWVVHYRKEYTDDMSEITADEIPPPPIKMRSARATPPPPPPPRLRPPNSCPARIKNSPPLAEVYVGMIPPPPLHQAKESPSSKHPRMNQTSPPPSPWYGSNNARDGSSVHALESSNKPCDSMPHECKSLVLYDEEHTQDKSSKAGTISSIHEATPKFDKHGRCLRHPSVVVACTNLSGRGWSLTPDGCHKCAAYQGNLHELRRLTGASTAVPLKGRSKPKRCAPEYARVSEMPYTTPFGEFGWYSGDVIDGVPNGDGRLRYKNGEERHGKWICGYAKQDLDQKLSTARQTSKQCNARSAHGQTTRQEWSDSRRVSEDRSAYSQSPTFVYYYPVDYQEQCFDQMHWQGHDSLYQQQAIPYY